MAHKKIMVSTIVAGWSCKEWVGRHVTEPVTLRRQGGSGGLFSPLHRSFNCILGIHKQYVTISYQIICKISTVAPIIAYSFFDSFSKRCCVKVLEKCTKLPNDTSY